MHLMTAAGALLAELLHGPPGKMCFILNPGDAGLLASLDALDAAAASQRGPAGGASIAAHVDHVRYGFELMNRWTQGENPFDNADFSASWRRQTVNDAEWADLRGRLRAETGKWEQALGRPRDLAEIEAKGVLASVAHLAYHIGAIRQIDASLQGPKEQGAAGG
jgi:hypothetical protein